MAWEELEARINVRKDIKPATVSLSRRANSQRLCFYVTLRRDLSESLGWKEKEGVGLQIGKGEDAGRARIVRGSKREVGKVKMSRFGVFRFDFGSVEALGSQQRKAAPCDARKIDENTVELVLPDWSETEVEDDATAPTPRRAAAGAEIASKSKPGNAPPSKPKTSQQRDVITLQGITIDLTEDDESITSGEVTMEITDRQAAFFDALMGGMPSPIGRDFLCKRVFGLASARSMQSDVQLDMIAADAKAIAAKIGLEVKTIKGIGYALVKP